MSQPAYLNNNLSIDRRVADLLPRMDAKEKFAQLRNFIAKDADSVRVVNDQVVFDSEFQALLRDNKVGSLQCLTRCDFWTRRKPEEGFDRSSCARIVNAVQECVVQNSRWGIPLLLFDDCRHAMPGVGTTIFPVGIAQASTWDVDLLYRIGEAIGDEMRSMGITVSVGPNLNLARDPRWSRMEETFGEDAWLAGRLGESYVKGIQLSREDGSLKVAAAIHFVCGMGDAENGMDGHSVSAGIRTLQELFRPFGMAIRGGAKAAMASYSSIDGIPCHANKGLLTGMMREQYGFSGLIEGDALGVSRIHKSDRLFEEKSRCVAEALNAGLNIDLYCYDVVYYTDEIIARAIDSGYVSMNVIDRLVADVLRVKFELGLFENPYSDEAAVVVSGRSPEHTRLALEAARGAITLLANHNDTLPLKHEQKGRIALVGPHADNVYNLLGDYTPFVHRENISTPLDGLRQVAPAGWSVEYAMGCRVKFPDSVEFSRALEIASRADYLIMTVGGSSNRYGQEFNFAGGALSSDASGEADCGEGHDRAVLGIFDAQLELWNALRDLRKPLIAVLVHGRSMCIPEIVDTADAIIDLWYPGEAGGIALAEVLFGITNPAGRLPVSIPRHAGQLPIYYNALRPGRKDYLEMSKEPLFQFGHGLSYTTFSYSDLKIYPEKITEGQVATLQVTVTNTGKRTGDEVVQLYITDEYSSCCRPDRELRGFKRITLQPDGKKTVCFEVGRDELMFPNVGGEWIVEPGTFTLAVGGSQKTVVCGSLTFE